MKSSLATGVWLFVAFYFAFHAFQGENSLSALKTLTAQEIELESEARQVAAERHLLEMRIAQLDTNNIDPDMLEEQVRKKLGFIHEDEVVLFIE
ncbi:septum formation initiator family protein [Kordiimonas sp. SCSIO 12610]|uniref:FtsB family cell division protein n=1 Tax=Kordiimonas sp. SCSIO 12610 TaxID=2829597 RepID=UPI00210981A1|nr:septum formation initiator family protein [Kordiimonas sp. SCSIO 12610]UTW54027.1 septum formation initiator family protein [Kordiimonas sp. SCSIO 12610]